MPNETLLPPEEWSEPWMLFDNGKYLVIAGSYDGARKLGYRSQQEPDFLNVPNQAAYAVARGTIWHIIPPFLEIPILHGLLDELFRKYGERSGDYSDAIVKELKNFHAVRR
jgi:hypothetical protein